MNSSQLRRLDVNITLLRGIKQNLDSLFLETEANPPSAVPSTPSTAP